MLKVGDLCVANYFGQWFNCKIINLSEHLATVEMIGSNDVAETVDGDDVAADVPLSALKPFGQFAVNKNGELIEAESEHIELEKGGWKAGDLCVVKWAVDKCWNNANILHIFSSSEILVFFTEIGSADFTTLADVRPAGSPLGADYVLFKSDPNETAFLKTILKTKSEELNNSENKGVNCKKRVSFGEELLVLVKTFEKICLNVGGQRSEWNVKKSGRKSR